MQWLLILFVILGFASATAIIDGNHQPLARLYPPIPSSGKSEGQTQSPNTEEHEGRQHNERGTKEEPLFIKIVKPSDKNDIGTDTNEKSDWQANPEWWTAIATVGLVLVTFLLWIFTALLWWSTRKAVRDGSEEIRLARQEFTATHRPKLRIHNVVIEQFNPTIHIGIGANPLTKKGEPKSGTLSVTNIGDSVAEIVDSYCMIFRTSTYLPMRSPYHGRLGNGAFPTQKIPPGGTVEGTFTSDDKQLEGVAALANRSSHVMGWVKYIDGNKTQRITLFCRIYEATTNVFNKTRNEDYERED